jgi:enamine deaminase RidA (YjgF/YER057c/UK114 family)
MQREVINPWRWQERYGFVQGNKVTDAGTTLYIAGQTAADENGRCMHPGDMAKQLDQTIANIETVLSHANMDFTQVVRLSVYTVDVPALLAAHDHMVELLQTRGCRHAGTLLGVSALADPHALVEIEVTAAC